MTEPLPDGLALKVERLRRGIMAKDLADQMGVDNSEISRLEARWRLTPKRRTQYLEALATLSALATSPAEPELEQIAE
jgi:transcriptional regulator with XRE-family HTH domain